MDGKFWIFGRCLKFNEKSAGAGHGIALRLDGGYLGSTEQNWLKFGGVVDRSLI